MYVKVPPLPIDYFFLSFFSRLFPASFCDLQTFITSGEKKEKKEEQRKK